MDSDRLEFVLYEGDLMGLTTTKNHIVFRWNRDDCKVLFSAARQGNAMSIHFASDSSGVKHVKKALDMFCVSLFLSFPWCTMILGNVSRPSVGRMIQKIGFHPFADCEKGQIYMRLRDGVR